MSLKMLKFCFVVHSCKWNMQLDYHKASHWYDFAYVSLFAHEICLNEYLFYM